MNSDTPETYAFHNRPLHPCDDPVEFAKELERDRNMWREFTERCYAKVDRDPEIENALQQFAAASKEDK